MKPKPLFKKENMNCRVCNSSELDLYYALGSNNQYHYYKCSNCKLVNLDLDGIKLSENQNKYSLKYKDPFDKKKNKGNYQTSEFVKRQLPNKGVFLDIGCGNGSLLYFLRQQGWEVKGIELTEFLVEKVTEVLKIEVDRVNFMEIDDFSTKYDALSLRHVLEHLPDSNLAMQNLRKLLVPGGYAVLEFPNIEAISFKTKRFLARLGLLKPVYPNGFVPGHCNEFSKQSFEYLAKNNNFELIKWETYSSKPIVNVFLKLFNIGSKARVLIKKTGE